MHFDNKKESILDEIARRVIELDGRRKSDNELREKINDYVETLNELTELSKSEIESIALEVVKLHSNTGALELPEFLKKQKVPLLIGSAAVLIALAILFTGKYLGLKESLGLDRATDTITDSSVNLRSQFIRANLSKTLSKVSGIKLYYLEHFMAAGVAPSSFEELGI